MKKQKKQLNNIKIAYVLLMILSLSHMLSLGYCSIFIVAICCLLLIFSNIDNCVTLLFMFMPFFNLFNNKIGSTSFYYIFIFIFFAKYISYHDFKLSKRKVMILLLLCFTRFFCNNLEVFFKWFCLFSIFILTYNESYFIKNIKNIILNTSISFIISSFVGYYLLQSGSATYIYTRSYVNGTIRFAGLIGDNIFFAQIALLLASLNFVIMYYRFNIKNLIIVIFLYVFSSLTISKTAIVLELILFLFFIVSMIIKTGSKKNTLWKSLIIIICTIIGCFFSYYYILDNSNNLLIKNYLIRFNSNDLLTGRGSIVNHYLEKIWNYPQSWFVSMKDSDYSMPFYPNDSFAFTISKSHNIYIETICCFGFIPTIFIFMWLLNNIFKLIKKDKILFLPILIMGLTGFSLHGHYEFHYYIILSLCFSVFSVESNNSYGGI